MANLSYKKFLTHHIYNRLSVMSSFAIPDAWSIDLIELVSRGYFFEIFFLLCQGAFPVRDTGAGVIERE